MILKYIITFIISFLLSQIISKLLIYTHFHTTDMGQYLSSQILWGKESIKTIILNIFYFLIMVLKGKGTLNLPYYLIITIITLVYTTYKVFKHKLNFITEYLPILFLIGSPFLLSIALGQRIAYRALLGFPIVLGFLFLYMINDSKKLYLKIY